MPTPKNNPSKGGFLRLGLVLFVGLTNANATDWSNFVIDKPSQEEKHTDWSQFTLVRRAQDSRSSAITAVNYNDCILENMKTAATPIAAQSIKLACMEKALPYTPEKCLDANVDLTYCKQSCLNESYWSKNFGDCKP